MKGLARVGAALIALVLVLCVHTAGALAGLPSGFSDTVVNMKKPGKISIFFRTISKSASGHGEPERKTSGCTPR